MTQIWHRLLFAHWPLALDIMRPLVPSLLPLDTFEGQCWISIIPFFMTYVRPRGIPPVPKISQFHEINVRTYVTLHGIPGIYFFSLDADNPVAVALARAIVRLPYFNAHMGCHLSDERISYYSHRTHRGKPSADFIATYHPTSPIAHARRETLEYWLAERYCLYTVTAHGHIIRVTIHHRPWPLQVAEADITSNTMARAWNIPLPATKPLLQYAHRQEVLVWPPTLLVP